MASRKEVIDNYTECEKNGIFDMHVDPVDYSVAAPVDTDFQYVPAGWEKFRRKLEKAFIVNPFSWHLNKYVTSTRVEGRENLKGIDSAIVTCNHVFIFDCLVLMKGLKHKVKYTVAEFNNRNDFLGEMMRAGGILPLSDKINVMKKFNGAVKYYLEHKHYVVFYPEQAMWYMYEKPRPFKNGAYHYAVKHNVPVIPTFITFRDSGKKDEEGLEIKYFTLHIMPPIYPGKNLGNAENAEYMKNKNYEMCKAKYEEVYKKPLVYTCGDIKC